MTEKVMGAYLNIPAPAHIWVAAWESSSNIDSWQSKSFESEFSSNDEQKALRTALVWFFRQLDLGRADTACVHDFFIF
jgi:hypothetical protein